MGISWRTTRNKIWKRVVEYAIFNLQQLRKILATKESVTGFTEVLQKTEVIPESIGLVIMKAQAGLTTNLVLSSFRDVLFQSEFLKAIAMLLSRPRARNKARAGIKRSRSVFRSL